MSQGDSRGRDWGTDSHGHTFATTRLGDTTVFSGRWQLRRRRAKRWWRRNRRKLRRWTRRTVQTITPMGWFVLAATLTSAALALHLYWVEAAVVAVIGAVVFLASLPFLLGSRTYLVRITVDRPRVVAGSAVNVSIDVENSSSTPALPAMAELPVGDALRKIPIPLIGPRARIHIPSEILTHTRGVIEVGPLTLARRDPLGLVRRDITWRDRHRVHVHPPTAPLPPSSAGLVRDLEGAASARLTDSDLSFHAVREYAPGDLMRHVHWRSTAKTGTLMVRQYEESQTARASVLFDTHRGEYRSEEEFELGVSAAASLSLQAVREGRERFIGSGWVPGRRRPSADGLEELPSLTPTQLLDSWAELEGAQDAPRIEWLARALGESRRPLSLVTIVTGSAPELTRLRRAALAFPGHVNVRVVRCEVLAEPTADLLDGSLFLTVGALADLPRLLARGPVR